MIRRMREKGLLVLAMLALVWAIAGATAERQEGVVWSFNRVGTKAGVQAELAAFSVPDKRFESVRKALSTMIDMQADAPGMGFVVEANGNFDPRYPSLHIHMYPQEIALDPTEE